MGRTVCTVEDVAKAVMPALESKTWQERHAQLKRLGRLLVEEIWKLGSPDLYLHGKNTGVKAPPVIALPDRKRVQLTLCEVGLAKRAKK